MPAACLLPRPLCPLFFFSPPVLSVFWTLVHPGSVRVRVALFALPLFVKHRPNLNQNKDGKTNIKSDQMEATIDKIRPNLKNWTKQIIYCAYVTDWRARDAAPRSLLVMVSHHHVVSHTGYIHVVHHTRCRYQPSASAVTSAFTGHVGRGLGRHKLEQPDAV